MESGVWGEPYSGCSFMWRTSVFVFLHLKEKVDVLVCVPADQTVGWICRRERSVCSPLHSNTTRQSMCDASVQSLFLFNQYRKYAKNFSLFLYWDHLSIMSIALFFFLPAYFIFSLLELFLLSCFMNVLTVTSLLVWQMNTASSTNPFKSRVFVFVASFYRHQSIRNGTAVKLQRHALTVGGPAGRRRRPPGLKSGKQNPERENQEGAVWSCSVPFVSLVFLLVQKGSV